MHKIFTDASCQSYKKVKDGICNGEIAIIGIEEMPIHEKMEINQTGLRQFINRFELLAIQKAHKLASDKFGDDFMIFSDSMTAVYWADSPMVVWIPRKFNLAGAYLEAIR